MPAPALSAPMHKTYLTVILDDFIKAFLLEAQEKTTP